MSCTSSGTKYFDEILFAMVIGEAFGEGLINWIKINTASNKIPIMENFFFIGEVLF